MGKDSAQNVNNVFWIRCDRNRRYLFTGCRTNLRYPIVKTTDSHGKEEPIGSAPRKDAESALALEAVATAQINPGEKRGGLIPELPLGRLRVRSSSLIDTRTDKAFPILQIGQR